MTDRNLPDFPVLTREQLRRVHRLLQLGESALASDGIVARDWKRKEMTDLSPAEDMVDGTTIQFTLDPSVPVTFRDKANSGAGGDVPEVRGRASAVALSLGGAHVLVAVPNDQGGVTRRTVPVLWLTHVEQAV